MTLDLSAIPSGGSALGADAVYVAFFFTSDDSVNDFAGPFIDDIALTTVQPAAAGARPGPAASAVRRDDLVLRRGLHRRPASTST